MNANVYKTICMFTLCICLIILMIQSYIDLYKARICSKFSNDISASDKPWNYNWDLKFRTGSARARDRNFILVRHGHYDYITGKLSKKGARQSNGTGRRIKIMNYPYSRIISSTMQRAMETAKIIQSFIPEVPLEKDNILEEGGPVLPNPKIKYWNLPERTFYIDGPRLESAFRKYFYRADPDILSTTYEIIVAHGNILRYFVLRALQFQTDAWMRIFIGHASITFLTVKGDGTVSILLFGDVGHLSNDDISY